jgi:DNA-binding CsgD family transcriptional regulator
MARRPDSLITALGFTRDQEKLYVRLLSQHGRELVSVAAALLRDTDDLLVDLEPFAADGIVRLEDGRVLVASPEEAVGLLLRDTADSAARAESRLRDLADALPFLSATGSRPRPDEVQGVQPLDGELSSGGEVGGLLAALLLQTKGDLLQLRPDQWRATQAHPEGDPMAPVLLEVAGQGRRMRTVYPVVASQEAPGVLAFRASLGEEIRLVPEVPTRMLLLGRTHAILPEPLGFADEPRSLVRQRGLVEALTLWFEEIWARASPLPDLAAAHDQRRFLLELMAGGAQDEQIARRLGISLRTVRRRVAEVLGELGAESRFQAGVEAARRGWI